MNGLKKFSGPTFYTPGQNALSVGANLPPQGNALSRIVQTPSGPKFYTPNYNNLPAPGDQSNPNNLTTKKIDPNRSPNALMALYNQDLGQSPGDTPSTGGDPNQGAGESVPAAQMSTQDLADEIGQLDAFNDVVGTGKGLGFSFGPVTTLANLYSAGKNKMNKQELEQRNRDLALQGLAPVGPTEFSFDPQMTEQEIADQNREMQRGITGTDAGLDSRNDPTPAPTGDPGDGQGSTVICTELHRQGYLSEEIYEADKRFGGTLDIEILCGYHRWAIPWVRVMRYSPIATRLTWLVARPWAQHMAFRMKAVEEDNTVGWVMMKIGLPLCRLLGFKRSPVGKRYSPPAN